MCDSTSRVVSDLMQAWNKHDIEGVTSFYATEYIGSDVGEAGNQTGPEGIQRMVERYLQAFPDLHFTIENLVVEGNRAALFWRSRGTHRGVLMNIPPTGRVVSVQGVSLLTVEGGKICRAEYIWDVAGLLRAIGLLPELS